MKFSTRRVRLSKGMNGDGIKQTTLRINPDVARALRAPKREVLAEIEDYLGAVDHYERPAYHQDSSTRLYLTQA